MKATRALSTSPAPLATALLLACSGCASPNATDATHAKKGETGPIPGLEPVDHLIEPGERHFAHLWKVTSGGENAEAYWSNDGSRLVLQRRNPAEGVDCDRIYVTSPEGGALIPVSDGAGTATCSYFLPGDREVIYASTRGDMKGCPPPVDFSEGYVWALWPEHDLWVQDLASGARRRLTGIFGYDAEATISPRGDRMVFTSTRSGDLELWTAALDGSDLRQVTDYLGYDGGGFFSHDGSKLVFRATVFDDDAEREQYAALLANWRIRPHRLEIFLCDADGGNRRQLTSLGGANWAPYFFPDDQRILFSSNHHDPDASDGIDFDLFAIGIDGTGLERVTEYESFDAFPMFSPDGRYLAFSSNRGGAAKGETNVFIAEWR